MKNILIIGYGITGQSFRRFFSDSEIRIFIYDDNKPEVSVSKTFDFSKIDLALLSAGIPKDHELLKKLHELKIRIISDLDLFFELKDKKTKTIGVTGTNGKSTTTALITKVLQSNGFRAIACGNFGIPLMDVVDKDTDFFVIELSSYELESNDKYKLDYGCLLNITPDHISHHGTFEKYKDEKMKILTNSEKAVLVQMTDATKSIEAKLFKFVDVVRDKDFKDDLEEELGNRKIYYWDEKILKLRGKGEDKVVFDASKLKYLSFNTNKENIAAVFAVTSNFGIDDSDVCPVIENFKNLPHRQEIVYDKVGIKIVNDSKATNLDATLKSLENFDGNVHLILGGLSKGDDFSRLNSFGGKIKKIYTYGKDGFDIASSIKGIDVDVFDTLEDVIKSVKLEKGDVLLLAPACASFDQFKSFEDRGEQFKSLVNKYLIKFR